MDYWSICGQLQNCLDYYRPRRGSTWFRYRMYNNPPSIPSPVVEDISPSTFIARSAFRESHLRILQDLKRKTLQITSASNPLRIHHKELDFRRAVEQCLSDLIAAMEKYGHEVLLTIESDSDELKWVLDEEFAELINTVVLFLLLYGLKEHAEALQEQHHLASTTQVRWCHRPEKPLSHEVAFKILKREYPDQMPAELSGLGMRPRHRGVFEIPGSRRCTGIGEEEGTSDAGSESSGTLTVEMGGVDAVGQCEEDFMYLGQENEEVWRAVEAEECWAFPGEAELRMRFDQCSGWIDGWGQQQGGYIGWPATMAN